MSFAFNIPFQVVKGDPEEAMYKELLIGLSNDTLPETVVFPDTIVPRGNFSHLNVHIDDSCVNILAYPNFPGTQDANMKPKLTFVGTDGSLNWNGSEWVKS